MLRLLAVCATCVVLPPALAQVITGLDIEGPDPVVGGTNSFTATYNNDPGLPATWSYYYRTLEGCADAYVPCNNAGGSNNSIVWLYPGHCQIRLDNTYMPTMPGMPIPPPTNVVTNAIYVSPPNTDRAGRGTDTPCLVMYGNPNGPITNAIPVGFYCYYDSGAVELPVAMDQTTWAEESLVFTVPSLPPTGWTAGHQPTFQFGIDTITDYKGMWLATQADVDAFDRAGVGAVIADYTQTNRLNYYDCCGNARQVVLSTHHVQHIITSVPSGFITQRTFKVVVD